MYKINQVKILNLNYIEITDDDFDLIYNNIGKIEELYLKGSLITN